VVNVVPLRRGVLPADEAPPAWFAVLGIALTRVEEEDLAAYVAGLQLPPQTGVEPAQDWSRARELTRAPGGDMTWWDREEAERRRLTARIGDADAVLRQLTHATDEIAEAVHGAAAVAAARQGCGDPYIIRVAAGAAMQAAHQRALAWMAGEPEHFFACKYQLFAAGHWPLGVYGGRFHIF
jgi:hypothetical protein